jgi:hypothetical protein
LAQENNIPPTLRMAFERSRREGLPPTASDLIKVLQDVCVGFGKCFILIDAIDEFDVNDANRITDLLLCLDDLASTGVKVFITSRALPNSPKLAQHASIVNISAREADIKAYVSQILMEDTNISELMDDQLRMEIMDRLAIQAQGM